MAPTEAERAAADSDRNNRPWPEGTPAQEATKEAWLLRIADHPATTDEDYAAAVSVLVDPALPIDEDVAARLVGLGFAHAQSPGFILPKAEVVW